MPPTSTSIGATGVFVAPVRRLPISVSGVPSPSVSIETVLLKPVPLLLVVSSSTSTELPSLPSVAG